LKYVEEIVSAYPNLREVSSDIQSSIHLLENSIRCGNKILVCGDGDSASDSDHIVGKLMKGFLFGRNLNAAQISALEEKFPVEGESIASKLHQGVPAISLVSQNAILTAAINDQDPNVVFAQQVLALGMPGDILIAISTSGNSKDVLLAAKVAKSKNLSIIGLAGHDGGLLSALCDVSIQVPAQRVDRIQELYLPIYHTLCAQLEHNLFEAVDDFNAVFSCESPAPINTSADTKEMPIPPALIVFDFDGVFTNNKVYTSQDGTETVQCDRRDSLGLNMLKAKGLNMLILTQETNPVVSARALKLCIPVEGGCSDKAKFLENYLADKNITPREVIYMGNDLNDLKAMKIVGYSVAPTDAHEKVKAHASLVVSKCGGDGAVRAFCEILNSKLEGST